MGTSETKALEDVRDYAHRGRVRFTKHARERLEQRCGGLAGHVTNALRNATDCAKQAESDRWRVKGPDLDGDELEVVLVIEDGVIVVTLF